MTVSNYQEKGRPVFSGNTAPSTAQDLTTVAEYAARVGNRMTGTNAERSQLATTGESQRWEGLRFYETDTGEEWLYDGGWKPASGVAQAAHEGRSGAPSPSFTDETVLNVPMLMKTGGFQSFTDGSGMVELTFSTPFPTACTHISITRVDETSSLQGPVAAVVDSARRLSRTGCKLTFPGVNKRIVKFTWLAIGF